jgi:hypothetical protein
MLPPPIHKSELKIVHKPKLKTIKLPEENTGENFGDL